MSTNIHIEAVAFVNEQIKSGKLSTAEVAATITCYEQAAEDDARRPLAGESRVARLRALIESREPAVDRRRRLLGYTQVGQRALNGAKTA